MKKWAITLFAVVAVATSLAQTFMNKDSLMRLLPGAAEDSNLVHLYINIGQQVELDEPEQAKTWYRKARDLSKKINYREGFVKYAANYTAVLNQEAKLDSSLIINREAFNVATLLKNNLLIAKSLANIGSAFQHRGQFDSAAHYYEKSKIEFQRAGDQASQARVSDMLQNLYSNLRQIDKAVELGEAALAYFRTSDDIIARGLVLSNLGMNYTRAIKFDQAGAAFREALGIARETGYKQLEVSTLLNMGDLLMNQRKTDSMRPYYERAIQLAQETGSIESESIGHRGLGLHYLFAKNYPDSYKHHKKALELSEEHELTFTHIMNLESMSSLMYAMQDPLAGEKFLTESTHLRDSLVGEESRNTVAQFEQLYESEKKQSQIRLQLEQLKRKDTLNYFLAAGAGALIVISLLSYRNYRHKQLLQKKRIEELETEKQLAATEAILKGEEQERTRLAKDLHDGLGGMLSGIKFSFQNMKENLVLTADNAQAFERSIDMLDSTIKEMRRVAHNMMPEILLKYGLDVALKEFCNEIDRTGAVSVTYQSIGTEQLTLEQTIALTVYRMVQELVNNAVKHSGAQHIVVQLHAAEQEKLLSITVEDDGKGFSTEQLNYAKGMGWSNIYHRVEFLKGKIDLNTAPGKGTSVLIEIALP